jgi:hypothetical protein
MAGASRRFHSRTIELAPGVTLVGGEGLEPPTSSV